MFAPQTPLLQSKLFLTCVLQRAWTDYDRFPYRSYLSPTHKSSPHRQPSFITVFFTNFILEGTNSHSISSKTTHHTHKVHSRYDRLTCHMTISPYSNHCCLRNHSIYLHLSKLFCHGKCKSVHLVMYIYSNQIRLTIKLHYLKYILYLGQSKNSTAKILRFKGITPEYYQRLSWGACCQLKFFPWKRVCRTSDWIFYAFSFFSGFLSSFLFLYSHTLFLGTQP